MHVIVEAKVDGEWRDLDVGLDMDGYPSSIEGVDEEGERHALPQAVLDRLDMQELIEECRQALRARR